MVQQLVKEIHQHNYIDDMTKLWFCQAPNSPRTPVFYTLTKIQNPTKVGRPIISGCDGPTERLFAFVDVTSLYTNIPQKEGIETVCKAYESLTTKENPPSQHNILSWRAGMAQ